MPETGEGIMNNQDFTTTISVDQTPAEVFAAINNVGEWWSGHIDGGADKLGAEFTYQYKDMHRSKQKVTEFTPDKRVVWHVLDSELSFAKDKSEWNGTNIVFDISAKNGKTELSFTHQGLAPTFECFADCSKGWGMLINGNLRKLIATGKSQPNAFA
jgi:hypothetical protein